MVDTELASLSSLMAGLYNLETFGEKSRKLQSSTLEVVHHLDAPESADNEALAIETERHGTSDMRLTAAAAEEAPEVERMMASAKLDDDPETTERIPRELDAASLLRTLAIKDAMLRQMEHALLMPPVTERTLPSGLSRRVQGLIANMRRREAVLALKLRGLQLEMEAFRKREIRSVKINATQRGQLKEARAENKPLRHELRLLRADLDAVLSREADLQRELLVAREQVGHLEGQLLRNEAFERKMRYDMEQLAGVALHAMTDRASVALGENVNHAAGRHVPVVTPPVRGTAGRGAYRYRAGERWAW